MPRSALTYIPPIARPSGIVNPADRPAVVAFPAITSNTDVVRYYQRILLGLGIYVGPTGADGRWGQATSTAVRNFQQWFNTEPPRGRAENLTVSGNLDERTQAVLQTYDSRASNVLVPQVPVSVDDVPVTSVYGHGFLDLQLAPSIGSATPPATSPWVVVGALAALTASLIAIARYADDRKAKR